MLAGVLPLCSANTVQNIKESYESNLSERVFFRVIKKIALSLVCLFTHWTTHLKLGKIYLHLAARSALEINMHDAANTNRDKHIFHYV